MNKSKLAFSMIGVLVFMMTNTTAASAQASRTWVSGVGDDVNPCSRTAPCKTFAGAISKTAAGGEIDVLDPGGFGAVTITKAMTIDGGGVLGSILACGTTGIIVNAGANDVVVIRNLSINGCRQTISPGVNGIRFIAGGELHVERTAIFGFNQIGIDFEPNQAGASQLVIDEVYLRDNAGGGVLVKPAGGGTAAVSAERLEAYSNLYGLRAEDRSIVAISNSVLASNANNGLLAASTSQAVIIDAESCVIASNGAGSGGLGAGVNSVVGAGGSTTIRISNLNIFNNVHGLRSANGGAIISFGNNKNSDDGAPTGGAGPQ